MRYVYRSPLFSLSGVMLSISVQGQSTPGLRTAQETRRNSDISTRYQLQYVGGIEVLPSGEVFVLDSRARTLVLYDRGLLLQRVIGESVVGESFRLSWPVSLGHLGDTVWVGDALEHKVSLFSKTGKLIRTLQGPPGGAPWLLSSGDILRVPPRSPGTDGRGQRIHLDRFPQSGGPSQVVLDAPDRYQVFNLNLGTSRILARQPFDDGIIWDISRLGDGVVYVDRSTSKEGPSAARVLKVDSHGRPIFDITLPYQKVPLEPEFVDSNLATLVLRAKRNRSGMSEGMIQRLVREALYLPKHAPSITGVLSAQDGTTWLRREDRGRSPVRWTVLDRKGAVAFNVDLPKEATVWFASQNILYADLTTPGSQPVVVQYTLR